MPSSYDESILLSLRRITRAIDVYSRHLAKTYNLTGPQLVCLRQLARDGASSPGELAKQVSLSAATVTGILDRLETRRLVRRRRNPKDKRRVIVALTKEGRELAASAPPPLHSRLSKGLAELPQTEQAAIEEALRSVVAMMEAEDIDAAPLLSAGPATTSPGEVVDFLTADEDSGDEST